MDAQISDCLKYYRLLLVVLVGLSILGCGRYDYYPKGIHKDAKKQVGKINRATYIVKKGDTLYKIGRRYGVDFKTLAKRNNIQKPYAIYVGQRIYVHGSAPAVRQSKKNSPAKQSYSAKKTAKKHPSASHSRVKLIWPAKGRLSSKFGPRKNRMHDGIDIAAKAGTTVSAAAAGKVVYADSRLTGYGNLIIVRHSSDLFTAYAHNQKNLVTRGQKVKKGQRIALVGSSGRSTGPHLHFEVRRGEIAVDPLAYLPKR